MKRALTLLAAMLMLATVAFADDAAAGAKSLSVHTYSFKYKDAEKAAAMIKLLLSAEGSMSIQPSTNALVVTDRGENLKAITRALVEFDVPPQPFRLIVRLVGASRVEGTSPRTPDELRDIAPKLGKSDQLTSLLKTTLNLRIGQTYIVGATKAPQSQRALMIVLVARK